MDTKLIRERVLSLAIRGKLVPQLASEEPASVLLNRIREERAQLVKEKKMKPPKQESLIFRGEDGLFYERVGKSVKCIQEEIPFEIPSSWEWVRLGDLFRLNAGKFISASKINATESVDMYPCYGGNGLRGYVESYNVDGDHSLIGRQGALCGNVHRVSGKFYATEHAVVARSSAMNQGCAYYYLRALNLNQYATSTAQPGLSVSTISQLLFPVPPFKEQYRIVSSIKSILSHVDEIEENQLAIDADFKLLKEKALDLAIQGKLTKQDPADEPASELLKRIKAEKDALIKAKKIKAPKVESTIYRKENGSFYERKGKTETCIDDEIPFDIPNSWEWVRLGSIAQINPRNRAEDNIDAAFMPMHMLQDGYRNEHRFEIRKWGSIKTGFTHFSEGDIVIAKITPCFQNMKSAIIGTIPNGIGAGSTELHVVRAYVPKFLNKYLLWLFESPYFIGSGVKLLSGTAGQQRISKEFISNLLVPIAAEIEIQEVTKKLDYLLHSNIK